MANQRMTQTQLVRSLAESCEVNNKTARGMLDCLSSMAIAEVKKNGVFVMPGIGRLVGNFAALRQRSYQLRLGHSYVCH